MPTFNRGYVVWKAISSVLAQTLSSWELLVIDDGSTDNTSRVLEEFVDPRITVHRIAHGGPSGARNRGLELARGELVAYLDSDNWWEPTFLESFDEISSAAPEAAAWYCGRVSTFWERTPGEPWRVVHDRVEPASILEESDVWMANAPDVNCLVHRLTAGQRAGGWDPDCGWVEDWDFFLRLWLTNDGKCAPVPKVLVHYRQVHGPGADGICGELREDPAREHAARQYLINKWSHDPRFDPALLRAPADGLPPIRAHPETGGGGCSHSRAQRVDR